MIVVVPCGETVQVLPRMDVLFTSVIEVANECGGSLKVSMDGKDMVVSQQPTHNNEKPKCWHGHTRVWRGNLCYCEGCGAVVARK